MKWFIFGLQLFPYVLKAVRAAEEAIVGEGMGSSKLALVTGVLETVHSTFASDVKDVPQEKVTKLVIGLVEKAVMIFNSLGVFRKTAS